MSVRIINADVFDGLAQLEDESVHCVVTSPPYWGLRCYGMDGQIGLEPTLGEHIETIVKVFQEVRRVLRKDGTVWLNYGDCYATSANGRSAADTKALGKDDRTFRDKPFSTVGPICDTSRPNVLDNKHKGGTMPQARIRAGGTLKPKDLCMVPARLAIALQDDGWWIRSEIIWAKPNPMPESIRDRPTSSHEKIYLLTKSQRYFYDADAVRLPPTGKPGRIQSFGNNPHRCDGNSEGYEIDGLVGANLRNVWNIATAPYPDAHFATFPPALILPCIKAGCPEGGTVLDPFGGAGTTGLVSDRLGRDAILIELNPEYCDLARNRIADDAPLFTEVA